MWVQILMAKTSPLLSKHRQTLQIPCSLVDAGILLSEITNKKCDTF